MPAWVVGVPLPRLAIRAMTAPARATAAPVRKAACIPAVNVWWLMAVIALAIWGGVPWVTGAMPTATALLTWVSWGGVPAGRQQAADLGGHDRAEDGGAEGAAYLHGGGLQPAGDAGQLGWGVADDDVGGADHHRGKAQASVKNEISLLRGTVSVSPAG